MKRGVSAHSLEKFAPAGKTRRAANYFAGVVLCKWGFSIMNVVDYGGRWGSRVNSIHCTKQGTALNHLILYAKELKTDLLNSTVSDLTFENISSLRIAFICASNCTASHESFSVLSPGIPQLDYEFTFIEFSMEFIENWTLSSKGIKHRNMNYIHSSHYFMFSSSSELTELQSAIVKYLVMRWEQDCNSQRKYLIDLFK